MSHDLDSTVERLLEFRDERDWDKYHNLKDLAIAISIESKELLEIFLWRDISDLEDVSPEDMQKLKEEAADIFIYLVYFCRKLDIDLLESVSEKIELNEKKYPIAVAKGSNKKYTDLKP